MKNVRMSIMYNSIYALVGGIAIDVAAPLFDAEGTFITTALKIGGVIGLTYYGMTVSKFTKVFETMKLGVGSVYPIQKGRSITDISTVYRFTLPCGLSVKDFDDKKDAIEQHLGKSVDIQYTHKEIRIEVYNAEPKTLYDYEPTKIKGNVPIIIGFDRRGDLVTCDLSDGEPHMLIAGESGSGKSCTIRAIITNLILMTNVKLHLIDLKMGAEFNIFSKSNKVVNFGRTNKDANDILSKFSQEVDRRYNLFFKNDVKDIVEYNNKFKYKKLDYEVLIIDEFADLQSDKESIRLLEDIGRKSRAAGLHAIIATQRPDHKVLNGNIKANFGTVLGLKTLNSVNSGIIIDSVGLERLRGKGHGLFKRGSVTDIQAPFISTDNVKQLIRHTFVSKPVAVIETANGNLNENDLEEALFNL